MVQVNIIEMMVQFIKVVFLKDCHRGMDKKYLIMVQYLQAFIWPEKKSTVNFYGKKEIFTKEIFTMMFFKDTEYINGEMKGLMKGIGKMEKWMGKEN